MGWQRWLIAGLLTTGVAEAQDRPPKPTYAMQIPPMSTGGAQLVWPSGLRMAVAHDPTRPVVSTTVVVTGGYNADAVGRAGTARLVEAAWWSTRVDDAGTTALEALVSGAGCEVDGQVDHDTLTFTSTCPADTVDAAMRVWSQLFTDPFRGIDEAELDAIAVRQRADETVRQRLSDRPILALVPYVHMQLFPPEHVYWTEPDPDLTRLTVRDLKAWAAEHVVPEHTTVALVGGWPEVDGNYGQSLVAANFAPRLLHPDLTEAHIHREPKQGAVDPDPADLSRWWAWAEDPALEDQRLGWAREPEPIVASHGLPVVDPPGNPHAIVQGPVDEPTVIVAWSLPPSWKGDDALHDVASRVLHGVVGENLVDAEPAMARFPGCQLVTGMEAATIACIAILHEGQEAAGKRVASRIIDQLSFLVDMEMRDRLGVITNRGQMAMVRDLLRSHTRMRGLHGSKASWVAQGIHLASNPSAGILRVAQAAGVTREQVVEVGETLLTRERAVSIQLEPRDVEEVTARRLPDNPLDVDAKRTNGTYWTRYATGDVAPAVVADRLDSARIAEAWTSGKVRVHTLRNGLPLVILTHDDVPMATLRLSTMGGTVNDPSDHFAHSFGRMFVRPKRADELVIGGEWFFFRDEAMHHLGLTSSVKNLEAAMWMLRDVLETASFTLRDRKTRMEAVTNELIEAMYEPTWHLRQRGFTHALGGHPLGRKPDLDDLASWDALTLEDVRDMWRSKWRADNSVLIAVVGAGAEEDVFVYADKFLGGWIQPPPEQQRWAPAGFGEASPPGRRAIELLPHDGALAEVQLVCPLPGDRAVASVVAELMDRALGEPWVSSQVQRAVVPGVGAVDVAGRVPSALVGPAVDGWLDLMDKAAGGALSDEDVRAATWIASRRHNGETRDPHVASGSLADVFVWGQPLERGSDLGAAYGGVTRDAVVAALKGCAASAYVGIAGEPKPVGASLKQAGLSFETVDWEAQTEARHQQVDKKGYKKRMKERGR